jgi:thiamine-monophosphate kinase
MSRGENALVAWLGGRFRYCESAVPIGIGDDMAGVAFGDHVVTVTTDMLLDGVHFDTSQHDFSQIGRKALACSLSDCAAMACEPRAATVSIAISNAMSMDDVKQIYEGMAALADQTHCPIVGGDTTSWKAPLAIDVAILAEAMSPRGPICRHTARPGDMICVSGLLGGSLLNKHLTFMPALQLARRLAEDIGVHAMMDISDGLAMDLRRLCEASGCDARLKERQLEAVISPDARSASNQDGRSPLEHALQDGEDFELLVAAAPNFNYESAGLLPVGEILERATPDATRITISQKDGTETPLQPGGYQHWQ